MACMWKYCFAAECFSFYKVFKCFIKHVSKTFKHCILVQQRLAHANCGLLTFGLALDYSVTHKLILGISVQSNLEYSHNKVPAKRVTSKW